MQRYSLVSVYSAHDLTCGAISDDKNKRFAVPFPKGNIRDNGPYIENTVFLKHVDEHVERFIPVEDPPEGTEWRKSGRFVYDPSVDFQRKYGEKPIALWDRAC